MPRGHPDWLVDTGQFSFLDMDTAEAMVRIGSPAALSRSGRVVWLTGFECDLHDILVSETGTGPVVRDTTYPFRGSACLKMTGQDVVAGYAEVSKRIPILALSKQGIEFCAWFVDGDGEMDFELQMQNADIGYYYDAVLVAADGRVDLYDTALGWVTVGQVGGALDAGTPLYLNFKMVVDPSLGKYVYIRVNDLVFDCSAYTADPMAVAWPGRATLTLYHSTNGVADSVVYVDDLIFTIDEP